MLVGPEYTRGLLCRYIERMTGLSRAQVTRLIARYTASGKVARLALPLTLNMLRANVIGGSPRMPNLCRVRMLHT